MPYCDILNIRKWIEFTVHDHFINIIHNLVSYLFLDGIYSEECSLGKANCPAIDQLYLNSFIIIKKKAIKYSYLSRQLLLL